MRTLPVIVPALALLLAGLAAGTLAYIVHRVREVRS